MLATGFPFRDFSFAGQYMPMLHDAINRARGVRHRRGRAGPGLDGLRPLCGYWEMGLAPWDVAAGTLLVRESGGMCSDMHKRDSWPIGGRVVAGNAAIGQALHEMIAPPGQARLNLRPAQAAGLAAASTSGRSSRRRILPTLLLGSSSRNST